jgi:CelD/BcsL family acetyltransferase involved in cellulose biosynthesis
VWDTGLEIVDKLSDQWEGLCAANPAAQPFSRPEWTSAYYRAFAPKSTLRVVTAHAGGLLTGVLPLVHENTSFYGLPVRKLSGAASFFYRFDAAWISELKREAALRAIWRAVKDLRDWDVIELPHMRREAALTTLLDAAGAEGYPTGYREAAPSAFIPLSGWDGDPDYWLLRCGRHFRHTFRTAARKLPSGAQVALRRVDSGDDQSLQAFFALERSGWKGEVGSAVHCREDTCQFFTDLFHAAARFGYLSMYFLDIDGVPVAAQFGLTLGGRYFALKCAFDEGYRACAPGHLIVNAILRDCAERGLAEVELGPVSEWKSKWTKLSHALAFHYVFNKGVYGRLLHSTRFKIIAGVKKLLDGRSGS